jgi:hypothetical protein
MVNSVQCKVSGDQDFSFRAESASENHIGFAAIASEAAGYVRRNHIMLTGFTCRPRQAPGSTEMPEEGNGSIIIGQIFWMDVTAKYRLRDRNRDRYFRKESRRIVEKR